MSWLGDILNPLTEFPGWTYRPGGPGATEPAALAALALLGHGRTRQAQRPLDWLVRVQSSAGSLGVTADHQQPRWPTSLAVMAWLAADRERYRQRIDRAVAWILQAEGATIAKNSTFGHDTSLVGWPWVLGTHSWVEPTAFHVLALRAAGYVQHPRAQEAQRLLIDRQLSTGGANYGNTSVLGQQLRAHVQPSGISLLAIAPAEDGLADQRVTRSLDYLQEVLDSRTSTASLCFALLGLAAHGRRPIHTDRWLAGAARRHLRRGPAAYNSALLALAALGADGPLITLPRREPGA